MTMVERKGDFLSALALSSASVEVDRGDPASHIRIDRELSDEIHQMSIREREKTYHDIHGVSDGIEEAPEVVDQSIEEVRACLDELAKTDPRGDSFDVSLSHDSNFAKGRWLCLIFLRKNDFDPQLAAEGILSHLHAQRVMVGASTIGRRMVQSDFTEQDLEFLKTGIFQLLPRRDTAGRAVLCLSMHHLDSKSVQNYRHPLNACSYLLWKAAMDEETQRKGLVIVLYNVGKFRSSDFFNPSVFVRMAQLSPAGPLRTAAIHFCYSSPFYRPLATLVQHHSPRDVRLRCRAHETSSHIEMRYQLMTFGIPVNVWPIGEDGSLSNQWHSSNLEAHRRLEESCKNLTEDQVPEIIVIPSRFDVLSDRGNSHHPGNMRLKYLVSDLMDDYNEAESKKDKMIISAQVVDRIRHMSGRFLQDRAGIWHVLSDKEACNRVSRAFRSQRRRASGTGAKLD